MQLCDNEIVQHKLALTSSGLGFTKSSVSFVDGRIAGLISSFWIQLWVDEIV